MNKPVYQKPEVVDMSAVATAFGADCTHGSGANPSCLDGNFVMSPTCAAGGANTGQFCLAGGAAFGSCPTGGAL